MTRKSFPRNFSRVFALPGDSTMTRERVIGAVEPAISVGKAQTGEDSSSHNKRVFRPCKPLKTRWIPGSWARPDVEGRVGEREAPVPRFPGESRRLELEQCRQDRRRGKVGGGAELVGRGFSVPDEDVQKAPSFLRE